MQGDDLIGQFRAAGMELHGTAETYFTDRDALAAVLAAPIGAANYADTMPISRRAYEALRARQPRGFRLGSGKRPPKGPPPSPTNKRAKAKAARKARNRK